MGMNKSNQFMAMATMMAVLSTLESGNKFQEESKSKLKPKSVNERRKCFNKHCNNYRTNSVDLYCSEECKIKAHKYQ